MDSRFPRLAGGTTGLTFLLVLLGIYTAAAGAGLACGQRWPLCDGAVLGLFPATWPSFLEWAHRLVAMVAGLGILATALLAWRGGAPRRIRFATAGAVALLPLQVLLGAETVWRYTLLSRTAHFGTALLILGGLVGATTWASDPPTAGRLRAAVGTAAFLAIGSLVLGPAGPLVSSPPVQVAAAGAGLAAYSLLLVGGLRLRSQGRGAGNVALLAAGLGGVALLVRRLVYTGMVPAVDLAATTLAVGLAVLTLLLARHRTRSRRRPTGSD